MRAALLRRLLSGLIVPLVVFVAIGGSAPTKACHCSDSKSQAKSFCPFGSLRLSITSLLQAAPPILPPARTIELGLPIEDESPLTQATAARAQARGPPA